MGAASVASARPGRSTPPASAPAPAASRERRVSPCEPIVLPNKEIAQGFAQSIFLLQSDAIETGRVEKEDDRQVVILQADGVRKTILKSDIKARKLGLSAMPEDEVKHLTKRELRDVVEFLASLKAR